MRILLLFFFAATTTFAQGLTANGQVRLSNGAAVGREVRLRVQMESARRSPYYVYTDSMGRFEIRELRALSKYIITVDGDDVNWSTTTVEFIPSGLSPRLDIFLQPIRTSRPSTETSVTVSTLQQQVPAGASKELTAAVARVRKNDLPAAKLHLTRALEIFPRYVGAHNEMAVILMKENRLDEAERYLRVALEEDPAALRPLMNLGLCLSRANRFADALPVLQKAVQMAPTDASGLLLLGVAQLKTGGLSDAEFHLKKSHELGGKSATNALYYLSALYIQRNEPAKAIESLELFLREAPNDPNAPSVEKLLSQLRQLRP